MNYVNLLRTRKNKECTCEDVANMLEICTSYYLQIENGNRKLDYYDQNGIRIDRFELCVSDSEWQFGDGHGCQISDREIV